MYLYHILALLIGMILDLIIGDPHGIWHPVISIGKLISMLDTKLNVDSLSNEDKRKRGFLLVFIVLFMVIGITGVVVILAYYIDAILGVVIEAILSCYALSARSLIVESLQVVKSYEEEGIEKARKSLSMIVGRDTNNLDLDGILRATVETVAENSSDGVIAPLLYLVIGGPILGYAYKAINTMDSMLGYKNERYEYFGYCAAKLDDIANIIPSRLTGILTIIAASKWFGGFDRANGIRIFIRDRFNHKSPNSAQSEAAFAGALRLRLGGPSYYFGKLVDKPTIGDDLKQIEVSDVTRSHRLLINMEIICFIILIFILLILLRANELI